MDTVSLFDAKNRLSALVDLVEEGQEVTITRRGKPAAVLISESEFRRSRRGPGHGLGEAILAWRARYGGVELTIAQLDSWRDRRAGVVPDLGT